MFYICSTTNNKQVMKLANNNDIKITNGKAFIYKRMSMRFFPISLATAMKMIANGEAQYYQDYMRVSDCAKETKESKQSKNV